MASAAARQVDAATAAAMLRAFAGDPLVGVDRHLASEWLRTLAAGVAGAHAHRVDGAGQVQLTEDATHELLTYLLASDRHGRPRAWALADKVNSLLEPEADAGVLLAGELRSALRATRVNDFADNRREGSRTMVRPTIPTDVITALDLLPAGLWHSIGGGDPDSAARAGTTMLRVRAILDNLGHRPSIVDDLARMLPTDHARHPSGLQMIGLGGRQSRARSAQASHGTSRELTGLGVPHDVQARIQALAKAVASRAAPAPRLRGLSSVFITRVLALTWMEAPDSRPRATHRAMLIDLLDRRRTTWAVLADALTEAGVPTWVLRDVLSLVDAADQQRRDAGPVGSLAAAIADDPSRWRQQATFTTPSWKTRARRLNAAAAATGSIGLDAAS